MPLLGTSPRHRYWLCTDGCGLTCATITWTLHIFAWSTTTKLIIHPWLGGSPSGNLTYAIYSAITALSLASHMRAMLSNPGAVPPNALPPPADAEEGSPKRWCQRCNAFKPVRAHHDSITGRCVVKLDHFCPWVNNAVGIKNHKHFLLFCFWTCCQCAFSAALLFNIIAACGPGSHKKFRHSNRANLRGNSGRNLQVAASSSSSLIAETAELAAAEITNCGEGLGLLTLLLFFEALLFGLFTLCMLCDQYAVLNEGSTKIARLKGDNLGAVSKVHEVFGAGSWLWRLVPTAMELPDRLRDDILGYTLPSAPEEDGGLGKGKGKSSRSSRHRQSTKSRQVHELGKNTGDDSSSDNERCNHHNHSGSNSSSSSNSTGSSSESEVDSEEESEAMARCRPLAEGGDPQAMLHLAIMYDEGRVASRNTARARRWLQRAASGVNAEASYRLGKYHEEGLGGLQPSVEKAKQLYTDAALEGDRMAAMALQRLNGWLNDDDGSKDDDKNTEEEAEKEGDKISGGTGAVASASRSMTRTSGGGLQSNRGAARSRRPLGGGS